MQHSEVPMESYEFIESGLIFNLLNDLTVRKFKFMPNDFAKHGDAFSFITTYYDKYRIYPEVEVPPVTVRIILPEESAKQSKFEITGAHVIAFGSAITIG